MSSMAPQFVTTIEAKHGCVTTVPFSKRIGTFAGAFRVLHCGLAPAR